MIARLLTICLILGSFAPAWGSLRLTNGLQKVRLAPYLTYYIDKQATLSAHEIMKRPFKNLGKNVPNFGITTTAVWAKLTVENTEEQDQDLLLVHNSGIDSIDVYWATGKGVGLQKGGFKVPMKLWPRRHRNPVLPFKVRAQEKRDVYIRVSNGGSLQVDLTLWQPLAFDDYLKTEFFAFGIYYGIMIVMILYNFFVFLVVRDKTYLFYILYIIAAMGMMASINGFTQVFLWPDSAFLNHRSILICAAAAIFWALIFAMTFLNTKSLHKIMHRIMLGLAIAAGLIFMAGFYLKIQIGMHLINILAIAGNATIFSIALYGVIKKKRRARFFLIAWSFLLAGSTSAILVFLGVLPKMFITIFGIQLGTGIEVILLSLALADRINIIKDEREEAQISALLAENRLNALKQELQIAKRIQQSILPQYTPRQAKLSIHVNYLPAEEIGGDYYDFHMTSGHQIGILVADVSGHGIPASLIASMVKGLFAQEKANADRPSLVLKNLNRSIAQLPGHTLITGTYVFLDLEKNTLKQASAGHPPVLFWNAQQQLLEELKPKGVLLGFQSTSEYAELEKPIASGDKVLIYTDGVTECADSQGNMYSDLTLHQFATKHHQKPANDFIDSLIDDMRRFTGQPDSFDDDVAVIAIDINA